MKTQSQQAGHRKSRWQLQEAKNRLSQVVEQARQEGPQTITLRGKPAAVVVSFDTFQELTRPRQPLSRFFRESPLRGVALDLQRNTDPGREVNL